MTLPRLLAYGALLVAALAWPAVEILDRSATEAFLVTPHADAVVRMNRELFAFDAPDPAGPDFARRVMELYGNPVSEPIRVLFVPDERFLRPEEMPGLTLLPVDPAKRENPLQVRTVRFVAKWTGAAAAVVGIALLAVARRLDRRRVAKSAG